MRDTRVQRIEAFGAALSAQDWSLTMKQNGVNKSYEEGLLIYSMNDIVYIAR